MTESDSAALFRRASRGDAKAIEELLQLNLPSLDAYVRKRAGKVFAGNESASDLVQSACREVLEHADRFRYSGEEGFRRWLFATALRKIRDRLRYHRAEKRDVRRRATVGGAPSISSDARSQAFFRTMCTPSRDAAMKEELARVEQAFAGLPETYRQVITLSQVEQLPSAEVAKRMGITDSYARVLLSRALARLARVASSGSGA